MEKTNIDFGIIEETFEIVIAFDPQGKILFGNKSAREKLDYSEDELKQRNMSEIFWQEFQVENQVFAPFDAAKLSDKNETVMY
ncbi:MAG: PAS domain S-box protein, partial [Lachnospiraceae bacterium]|nr:PAS domain S-box protein [Lachnospiraceae bacterium]